MKETLCRKRSGFTLVEVIVALMLVSVLAAMMMTFISQSLNQVNRPRETLDAVLSLQSVMESVVARHELLGDLSDLSAEVGSESSSASNNFGVYQVQHNRFVTFDGGKAEISSTNNSLLKISIRNDLGETVTRLFTGDP